VSSTDLTGDQVHVRLIRLLALLAAVLVGLLALAAPAAAGGRLASDGEEPPADELTISVRLVDRAATTEEFPQGTPIEGVTLEVLDQEGATVGEAETDAEGVAAVPIPGGGTYDVRLDEDSLPDGTELSNPDQVNLQDVQVLGFSTTVQFPIGLQEGAGGLDLDRIMGLLISGVKFGLIIALASLGLSLVFGTTGLTNFAHGELITLGAMLTFGFNVGIGMSLFLALPLAVLVMMAFGWAQDVGFWRPLRKRGTGNIALMIVSIGMAIFLRNLFLYIYGGTNRNYGQYATQGPLEWGPVSITPKEIVIIVVATIVLVAVSLALSRTRLGKATRAVADNPALASSSGINVSSVITLVWIMGTGLAGLAGALLGLAQGSEYQMGVKILLLVFAAVTLGGLGTIWGAMAGSLIVGLLTELSTLVIPGELKYVGALVVLIVVLVVKPQGIFGRRERVG
jgi:branched-chain amino acid transport system permease protein